MGVLGLPRCFFLSRQACQSSSNHTSASRRANSEQSPWGYFAEKSELKHFQVRKCQDRFFCVCVVLTYWSKVDQIAIYLHPSLLPRILHWTFVNVAKGTATHTTLVIFSFNHKLHIDLAESLMQQNFDSQECTRNK